MPKLDIMYRHNSDEWETPQDLYDELDREFHFTWIHAAVKRTGNAQSISPKQKTA